MKHQTFLIQERHAWLAAQNWIVFNLNPAVVISFKNTDDNHFVGIHEKRYLIFLLLILYSYYYYYKIIFSFNQTKYVICDYFPLPVDSSTVQK